jgi:hypothetical protein
MSTSVLDPTHIDLILVIAIHGPTGPRSGPPWVPPRVDELLGKESHLSLPLADPAGAALLSANIESVRAHYADEGDQLPGPIPTPNPAQYEWTDLGLRLTIPEALRAIDTYEYRTDGHPAWPDCGAAGFCARLRAALTRQLPGYMEAPAVWTADLALSVAPRRMPPDDFRGH